MSTSYPNDLSDAEWECVQRYLPALSQRGRPRTHRLRRILDAIFSVLRTRCPWRYLPSNIPVWQTVYYHFRQFRRKNTLKELAAWCLQQGDGWALEVVEREPGTRRLQVQPRRWSLKETSPG